MVFVTRNLPLTLKSIRQVVVCLVGISVHVFNCVVGADTRNISLYLIKANTHRHFQPLYALHEVVVGRPEVGRLHPHPDDDVLGLVQPDVEVLRMGGEYAAALD